MRALTHKRYRHPVVLLLLRVLSSALADFPILALYIRRCVAIVDAVIFVAQVTCPVRQGA